MIGRLLEIERRLEQLADDNRDLRQRLSAAFDRLNQVSGNLGGILGASSTIALARAVGTITARSGTTLGTGTINFAEAPAGTLVEGTTSATAKNLFDMTIADNAWLVVVKEPDWWFVVAVDDCASLS